MQDLGHSKLKFTAASYAAVIRGKMCKIYKLLALALLPIISSCLAATLSYGKAGLDATGQQLVVVLLDGYVTWVLKFYNVAAAASERTFSRDFAVQIPLELC